MKAVKFEGWNKSFDAKGCHTLFAFNDGKQTISCWEMDREDFSRFLSGEKIYVAVLAGESTPPIQVFIGKPPFMEKDKKDIDPDKNPG